MTSKTYKEIICSECQECPARHECQECGNYFCDKDQRGCWVFQRTMWSQCMCVEEISAIEKKYPNGICQQCVEDMEQ